MQRKLFGLTRTLLGAALLLSTLTVSALAADNITVLVDDNPVQFTDVRPLIRGDRTYVPFRAIFEHMDASVTWNAETRTILATRNGREVRFEIGKSTVHITAEGSSELHEIDATPFIEGNRTYVPLRFAADALGACVDWVAQTRTVLIADVDRLMGDYADDFGTMDAYLDFAGGDMSRDVSGSFSLALQYDTAMGALPVGMTGAVTGRAQADAIQLAGTVKTDTAALRHAIEQNEGKAVIDSEIEALLRHLSSAPGEMVLSRTDGKVYLSSPLLTELGVPADGWAAMPYEEVGGTVLADLRTALSFPSFAHYAAAASQQIPLKHTPYATVSAVRNYLDRMRASYGDAAFQAAGSDRVLMDNAGRETLRLSYTAAGAVERAQLAAAPAGSGYRITIDQSVQSYALRLVGAGERVRDLDFTLQLSLGGASPAPAVRPGSGEIRETTLP